MTSSTHKKVIGYLIIAAIGCCAAYFQLFSRAVITTDGPNAREIIAAAEAIRNAAVAQPHVFGIDKTDVHTLRFTDSVPSSKAGIRHVYIGQEVGGVPIINTVLSAVVKLAPSTGNDNSLGGNNLRTADEAAQSKSKMNTKTNIVKIISSSKHYGQALVKNAFGCVNSNQPVLRAEEALSVAANEVLGVNNPTLRRRILVGEEDVDSGRRTKRNIRQRSVFEPHDGISINDTPCQLSYWSIANDDDYSDGEDCNVRLSWECIVKPDRTNYMHIFIDAVDGNVIHVTNFGPKGENDNRRDDYDGSASSQQQQNTEPLRRRLSAFSAVPYPNEGPCPSCPQFSLNMSESDEVFHKEDVEPLALVQNPEYKDSSPNGWLTIGYVTYSETRGNNARAAFEVIQDSADFDTSGETAFATSPSSQVFDYTYQSIVQDDVDNFRLKSSLSASLEAAVVNAFYWANIIHDVYYQYGFNEESGNFQEENFGKGGLGGDSVIVEVRETSTFNQAYFVNAPDGENPILILFLFIMSGVTTLEVDGEEYSATPFAFGPTEFNLTDASIVSSYGRSCQSLKDNAYGGSVVVMDGGGADGGDCPFSMKVKNAQNRGAVGVILVVDPWDRPGMYSISDEDASIYIPSVSITKNDAERLVSSLQPTSKTVLGPGLIVRDAAFDSSIIIHEYCHGISTRLTGGPSSNFCLNPSESRELGKEGWEDICSLFLTATNTTGRTRTIGSFASWSVKGVRPYPYSTDMDINPTTYGYLNQDPGSHLLGSIFGSMLWDMYWAIIDAEEESGRLGFNENKYDSEVGGSNIAMQLIIEGLKTQPCTPSFVQSRDAILLADELLYDAKFKCVIWEAFARRGLGESAVSATVGSILNVTESFDVPFYCLGPGLSVTSYHYAIDTGDGDAFIDNCELLKLTIRVENTGFGNLTDLQLVNVSSNVNATILSELPIQLSNLPEKTQLSIDIDLIFDGLVYGKPLELEAKFSAMEVTEPLSISIAFTDTSTDFVPKTKVTWEFVDGDDDWSNIDGYFSLEPSRSPLTIDNVAIYSPVAMFGPQQFSLIDVAIQEGQGLGCEEVEADKFAGSVALFESGGCDFTLKVENAQNGGALGVIIINYADGHPYNMDGQNPNIMIPAVMVGYEDGQRIKQNIDTALATLTFDAERKEFLSSLSIPAQCNRVRSPSFALYDNSAVSIFVSFAINGTTNDLIYDRANIGLFSGGARLTIVPDDGHKYNSYGAVNTEAIESCPAPGASGWRLDTGATFKEAIFSSEAFRDTNMIGEIVQLDIALATGENTYGTFFLIKKVELTNVGIAAQDNGRCASLQDLDMLNSTFTTSSLTDSEVVGSGTQDVEVNSRPARATEDIANEVGGLSGGFIFLVVVSLFAIPFATLVFLNHVKRRTERDEMERSSNHCELATNLENPMRVLDISEVTVNPVVPVPIPEEEKRNEYTFCSLIESLSSLSSLFASSSECEKEENHDDDVAQDSGSQDNGSQSDDVIEAEGAHRMSSFLTIFQ